MSKLLIPNDVLDKMTCMTCNNYLSFFPVYIKNDSSGAICGRCKVTDEDKFIRDEAYENIAQFLLFPCRYKSNGCKEQLTPQKIDEHEKSCSCRKFDCPSKDCTKCQWQGPLGDLTKHFEEKHPALLLREPKFELNFINSHKENILFPFGNELFVVKKEIDSRTEVFLCTVEHLRSTDTAEYFNYFIRLLSGNKTYTHKYPEKSTIIGDDSTTKIIGDFVKEKLKGPASIIVNIEVLKANREETETSIKITDIKKDPNINWDLLAELECPVCYDFMLPPIYQCIDGHSICSYCKTKVKECPLCKKGIQDTKNFALEKMTQFLTYPCKYYKSGCSFSAKSFDIRNHEHNCEFGPYECPLKETEKCQWKSYSSEVINHVENNHDGFILKSDKVNIPFDKNVNIEHFHLITFSEKIFKLHFKYADRKFYWSVQLVGPPGECRKFKFEIDVVDNSANKLRCYLKGMCVPVTKNASSFKNSHNYLMVTQEQIDLFITETFCYRIRVLKD